MNQLTLFNKLFHRESLLPTLKYFNEIIAFTMSIESSSNLKQLEKNIPSQQAPAFSATVLKDCMYQQNFIVPYFATLSFLLLGMKFYLNNFAFR